VGVFGQPENDTLFCLKDLDKFQVNEILRCLMHTIIFVRYPPGEHVRPKEVSAGGCVLDDSWS
jgi:hypothetical protein